MRCHSIKDFRWTLRNRFALPANYKFVVQELARLKDPPELIEAVALGYYVSYLGRCPNELVSYFTQNNLSFDSNDETFWPHICNLVQSTKSNSDFIMFSSSDFAKNVFNMPIAEPFGRDTVNVVVIPLVPRVKQSNPAILSSKPATADVRSLSNIPDGFFDFNGVKMPNSYLRMLIHAYLASNGSSGSSTPSSTSRLSFFGSAATKSTSATYTSSPTIARLPSVSPYSKTVSESKEDQARIDAHAKSWSDAQDEHFVSTASDLGNPLDVVFNSQHAPDDDDF